MSYNEFIGLNDFKESEQLSGDNHVYHYGSLNGKSVEVDEDLETMEISVNEITLGW